jgi:hypothetical protein
MPDLIETLEGAKNLLLTKGWTQGVMARNAGGSPTPCQWEDAACFCIMGAISRASEGDDDSPGFKAIGAFVGSYRRQIAGWNDAPGRTLDEVIAVLNRAIADARQQTEAAR